MTIAPPSPAPTSDAHDRTGGTPLADALIRALHADDEAVVARLWGHPDGGRRDRLLTLLTIYDLHTAPLADVPESVRWQHHPAIAAVKTACEQPWLNELQALPLPAGVPAKDPVEAIRQLAARNRLPRIYRWLATDADIDELVQFLSLEGGPDAGFDDLVAACQVGLTGDAKMELATNYWDEMGVGNPVDVHTTLHEQLVSALGIRRVPRADQPTSALARAAFCGLLATNRWLQPEMLGALGLIELQAGPRCRLVLQAFDRVGAPDDAYPFYAVHAEVDPRHGKDWLDNAIRPTVIAQPAWSERIIRGAQWRAVTDAAFLDDVSALVGVDARLPRT